MKAAFLASPVFVLLALLALGSLGCRRGGEPEAAGVERAEVAANVEGDVEAGRRMYREGVRPSGEPLTATVTEDVPFLGTQFSCESCHGQNGCCDGMISELPAFIRQAYVV